MRSINFLFLAAASGAFAVERQGFAPQIVADSLKGRDAGDCVAVIVDNIRVALDIPDLPTLSETAINAQITDPCMLPVATGSASSAIAAYSSEMKSWENSHSAELRSIGSACNDLSFGDFVTSAVSEVGSFFDYGLKFTQICSTALAPITSATGITTTADTTIAAGPTVAPTNSIPVISTTSPNAAPRETSVMMAAVAAAGVAFAAI